ncbi:hypothetical protein N7462_000354 [Penicillium macrosclerotiorum]|uniref:uncharacterized protein n=1 Tax=Penicillium macrosclerotiorum TaxID=303699 RepID=UPI00254726A6|nr:uncharacterized protein N7462_000354 [Penicillium macrosclerotiorum]KAJ5698349.1 hypothetical protein N7462_000354 [Penicillium macrosclerotiorum]
MARHRKIVCSNCRRRKSKCDGGSPSCTACVSAGSTCQYEKGPSIAYVRALQARIHELENSRSNTENLPLSPSPYTDSVASPQNGNSISLDERGDVSYHNQTSAIHEALPAAPSQPLLTETSLCTSRTTVEQSNRDARRSLVANAIKQKALEPLNLDSVPPQVDVPKGLASVLLQLHWCWLHPSFLFVYRPAFTREMPLFARGDRAVAYCSATLLKVLYAHSCRFIRAPEIVWSTIQALLQQSARDIACGRSSSAWLYSGMAFRMAIDIGLHVSPDKLRQYSTSLSTEDIEIRKRLFWSLFAWDKHISLYLGRMPNFVTGIDHVSLEFLDDFTDRDLWAPFYGPDPVAAELPVYPPTPGYVISCFTELCKLCKILTQVMLELYSSQHRSKSILSDSRQSSFVRINTELRAWWSDLPLFLRIAPDNIPDLSPPPHITSLNLMYHNTMILLHRPHVSSRQSSPSSRAQQSWKICRGSTTAIYDLLNMYVATFGFHHITYMNSYCTYTAATTAVYQLETAEDGVLRSQSLESTWAELKFLLDILQRTAVTMPGLNRSIDIIHTRIKKILDRQVSRQLESLFPTRPSVEGRRQEQALQSQPVGITTRLEERVPFVGFSDDLLVNYTHNASRNEEVAASTGNILEQLDMWLPAFPGQDFSYGSGPMLDAQDILSPEARSTLMGSSLDPHIRLDLDLENA